MQLTTYPYERECMETWGFTAISLCALGTHSGDMMNDDELERIWKELVVAGSMYYSDILNGLKKTTKDISRCS
jgi:hypothetical protein